MVKTILSISLLFFLSTVINAQNEGISGNDCDDKPNLHLGIKAGIGLSTIESTELKGGKVRPGLSVGLYGNYLIQKHFLAQIGFDGNLR